MIDGLKTFWSNFYKETDIDELEHSPAQRLFRGVSDSSYKLIPSIGRGTKEYTDNDITSLERNLIEEFKRLSTPEIHKLPQNDFEWIFLAQHYGLPTRLLDWSSNPMVALFFAVCSNPEKDGILHITVQAPSDQYEIFNHTTADVLKRDTFISRMIRYQPQEGEVIFVRPKYTDQRYINQKSVFSCPANPFEEIKLNNHKTLLIEQKYKKSIRNTLRQMGISHSYIYPGLQGITEEIKSHSFVPVVEGRHRIATLRLEI